jgi:hypothetical protein
MKIDPKLMTVDQSRFEISALNQISEDDSLCKPDCVPITYNISASSIHGNIYITPTYDSNVRSSLVIHEQRNDLDFIQ